jgi:citrate synthase
MGFPTDMFPVLFSIPRMAGWLAHWKEFNNDNENQIVRPRQNYEGHSRRSYVPMAARPHHEVVINSISSVHAKRRNIPS